MSQDAHGGITGVTFDSDGHQLVGVLYLAHGNGPKPTALLLHGCPGLEQNADLAANLRERGWNTLIFHYRGCWGSGGQYDLDTIPRDVRAAVDHLESVPYPGVDPGRLAVAGHSLGGWAAILAAADDDRLRAVVTIAAPVALGGLQVSDRDLEREFTRFLAATPTALRSQQTVVDSRPGPLDVIAAISPRPLLIVHGTADKWVPIEDSRLLCERSGQPCQYTEMHDANHAFSRHRATLIDLVAGWLTQTGV